MRITTLRVQAALAMAQAIRPQPEADIYGLPDEPEPLPPAKPESRQVRRARERRMKGASDAR